MGLPATRVSQDSIENFCKHSHGILNITTRSIGEEHDSVAADVVQEVLQDDLYQDPVQVRCAAFC